MGITASLVLRARFADATQADRVARYLPEEGRAALIDDVAAVDQDAYRVIEDLEYALVTRVDATTVHCSFEFSMVEDFDDEAPRVLARFQQLGAVDLLGVVIADEENRLYVALEDESIALLVLDRKRALSLRDEQPSVIFSAVDQLLATGVKRWPGEAWDAPDESAEPLLIVLPTSNDEEDADED